MVRNSSFRESPVRQGPRRLADWINPVGARTVHSVVDKVYKAQNLYMAWERVKVDGGAGGIASETLKSFEARLDEPLKRRQEALRTGTYQPPPRSTGDDSQVGKA